MGRIGVKRTINSCTGLSNLNQGRDTTCVLRKKGLTRSEVTPGKDGVGYRYVRSNGSIYIERTYIGHVNLDTEER